MANEQNLMIIKTPEEAKERGRNGGLKSAEARRRKKSMKMAAQLLLSLPVQEKNQSKLRDLNIDAEDTNNQMLILVAMLGKAISGDIKAAKFIRDTAGEGPTAARDKMAIKADKERIELMKAQTKKLEEKDGPAADGVQDKMDAIDGILSQMYSPREDEL